MSLFAMHRIRGRGGEKEENWRARAEGEKDEIGAPRRPFSPFPSSQDGKEEKTASGRCPPIRPNQVGCQLSHSISYQGERIGIHKGGADASNQFFSPTDRL